MDCEDFSLTLIFITSSLFAIIGALNGAKYYSEIYGGSGCSNIANAIVTNYVHCGENKWNVIVSYPIGSNEELGYKACLLDDYTDRSCKNIFDYEPNSEQKIYQCSETYYNSWELSHELVKEGFFLYSMGTFLTFLIVIRLFWKEFYN